MHLIFVTFLIFIFLYMSFIGATVFFGLIATVRYAVDRMQGRRRYVVSWRLVKLWLLAIPLLAVVLMAWHLVLPRANRTYTSPDGEHRLRLAIYNTLDIDVVRFKATLENLESGEELGEISELVRELFVQGWPDSEWAKNAVSVQWNCGENIAHVIIADMDTAYALPSGKILSHVPPWTIAGEKPPECGNKQGHSN